MKDPKDPVGAALNTAYRYNTRAPAHRSMPVRGGWHAKIDELLGRDYSFLGFRYSDTGYLFRGLRTGLTESVRTGQWCLSIDPGPLGELERELSVYLFSHDLSDALSVARLWESPPDAAVLVFPAAEFSARCEAGSAAVLGFAEPGVVFKYPFMVEPLPLAATTTIIVPATHGGMRGENCIDLPVGLADRRREAELYVLEALRERGMSAAEPVTTDRYPRRC